MQHKRPLASKYQVCCSMITVQKVSHLNIERSVLVNECKVEKETPAWCKHASLHCTSSVHTRGHASSLCKGTLLLQIKLIQGKKELLFLDKT